jgi:hypothetical protein
MSDGREGEGLRVTLGGKGSRNISPLDLLLVDSYPKTNWYSVPNVTTVLITVWKLAWKEGNSFLTSFTVFGARFAYIYREVTVALFSTRLQIRGRQTAARLCRSNLHVPHYATQTRVELLELEKGANSKHNVYVLNNSWTLSSVT